MSKLNAVFINENGNSISMSVETHEKGITVWATSPTTEVEHTWTDLEARTMSWLIATALSINSQQDVTTE